jgi:hypothetical protein
LQEIIDSVTEDGIILLASAGNSNLDVNGTAPSGCDNIIVVGSNNLDGNKSIFSNYGNRIDITAYGELLTSPDAVEDQILTPSGYIRRDLNAFPPEGISGTSFSITHATATAIMMKEKYGDLVSTEIFEHVVKTTAVEHPQNNPDIDRSCASNRCGAGILQSYESMRKIDSIFGYESIALNSFSDQNTCQQVNELEALNFYFDVCGTFTLSINNPSELDGTYYEIISTGISSNDFTNAQVIETTTTDISDRTFQLLDINLEQSIYAVRSCDIDRCYPEIEITFDLSNQPELCN